MNRFTEFYKNMNPEEWEKFSTHILLKEGYQIISTPAFGPDGGKDYLVEKDNIVYLVSCKHYIGSDTHVGINDELNILERLAQHNAKGFIGFYSTNYTQSLYDRCNKLAENSGIDFIFYTPTEITLIAQSLDNKILQSYGLYPDKYYLNVSPESYEPLMCLFCEEQDILAEENIPRSLVGLLEANENKCFFVYGCKNCALNHNINFWAEIEQILHLHHLHSFENSLEKYIQDKNLVRDDSYYKIKSDFMNKIRQRQFPQTEGTWGGVYPDDSD